MACCEPTAPLGRCCNTTASSHIVRMLPTLAARGQAPAWDRYLDMVYGAVDIAWDRYPVDLRTFGWFYFRGLPLQVEPAELAAACESRPGHAWYGPVGCGAGGHGLPESQPPLRAAGFFVQRPATSHAPSHFANNTWVEVMRTYMARRTSETPGSWYWAARGSGVWWNVGRTFVDTARRASPERHWFFDGGGAAARRLAAEGFTSLQLPRLAGTRTYAGAPVHNDRVELIALHAHPGLRRACADEYRAGFGHDRACICSGDVVNCARSS